METKERLLDALRDDLNILMAWLHDVPHQDGDLIRLSAEIRRVVSLIAEIDHE